MKGLSRFFAIALGLLALLLVGGWLWLSHYIEGPEFSALVKKETSRSVGAPVEFNRLVWELRRGITLNNLELYNGDKAPARGEFKAEQILLKYDWPSLLERRFEVTRLTIQQPTLIIGQDAEGNYVLPIAPPPAISASATQAVVAAPSTGTSTSSETASPITVAWRSFDLYKGTVEVKNGDGSRRLLCSGIEVEANALTGDKPGAKGLLRIGEIWLLQKVKITSVRSPLLLEGDVFSLSAIEAETYGGRINGSWEQNFSDPKKTYNLKLNLDDCDVNAVLSGVVQQTGVISGRLDAKTLWLGPSTDPLAVSGKGTLEIHNGQLIQVPAFRVLSQLLGINALSQPDFSEAKAEFTVADQIVTISMLQLQSTLFELSGTGTVNFDGTLKMQCRLDLAAEVAQQLPSAMAKSLEKRDNGMSSLPFKLSGTVNQPKVELVVTQGMVNQAADLLKSLFGKKTKNESKTAATPATTTVTPAADASTASPTTTTTASTPAATSPN